MNVPRKSIQIAGSGAILLSLCAVNWPGLGPVRAATPATHAAKASVKIGAYGPLTGAYAASGIDIINSVKLAAKDANKHGGADGHPVTVDAQDSPCSAQIAVQAAQKLVTDGVSGVVGPYCSGDAIPASVVFNRASIPVIAPASTNVKLTEQGFNNVFRTIGRDDTQGKFAASLMAKKFKVTRVAIVHDNSTYSKGLADATKASLAKYPSVKIVYFDAITPGGKDFSSTLTAIRGLKPQLTYFTGYFSDGGLFVKQFVQLQLPGRFMAGDANNEPTFISLAGSAANKALITTSPTPDLVPSAKAFVRAYRAAYHLAPGAYSAYAYDATNVLFAVMKKTHSTSPATLVKALHKVKNYKGITGKITFDKKGDRVQIQYIVEAIKGGKFVRAKI